MRNQKEYKPLTLLCEGSPRIASDWVKNKIANMVDSNIFQKNQQTTVRGPDAVSANLKRGLRNLDNTIRVSPPDFLVTPWVGVLNDPSYSLPWAIQAKNNGKIKKLVAGPNLVLIPDDYDAIITNPAIDIVVTPSKWVSDLYRKLAPELDNRLVEWAVGVDERFWCPGKTSVHCDFLIFNKISDDESAHHQADITNVLVSKNLTYHVLAYGEFNQLDYRSALQNARAVIYLGATESQGISLFEAWSCNVPTLVRDCQVWKYQGQQYQASAAPYLTDECGMFFRKDDFPDALGSFLHVLPTYEPRNFITRNFTLERSAQNYLDIFHKLQASRQEEGARKK